MAGEQNMATVLEDCDISRSVVFGYFRSPEFVHFLIWNCAIVLDQSITYQILGIRLWSQLHSPERNTSMYGTFYLTISFSIINFLDFINNIPAGSRSLEWGLL